MTEQENPSNDSKRTSRCNPFLLRFFFSLKRKKNFFSSRSVNQLNKIYHRFDSRPFVFLFISSRYTTRVHSSFFTSHSLLGNKNTRTTKQKNADRNRKSQALRYKTRRHSFPGLTCHNNKHKEKIVNDSSPYQKKQNNAPNENHSGKNKAQEVLPTQERITGCEMDL